MGLIDRWRDVSISKKLYFAVGIMAFLIIGELLTLRFAMHTLSAARAFVGGEGLWSKSQKNAAISLQLYGRTSDEADFDAFLTYLKVPEGDHQARVELFKASPDLEIVRAGFLRGQIHADDIEPMIDLLVRFHQVSFLARAIAVWGQADDLLIEFKAAGLAYHAALVAGELERAHANLIEIRRLNQQLTTLEDEFSYLLGAGSRWLERVVLALLSIAVLIVESIGLSLTFLTSRSISRGLGELNDAALHIGRGNFTETVTPRSKDEIGQLARSVNQMGGMLQRSYSDLELRVEARTAELARSRDQLDAAVRLRDEFLSIASHELKTPLTSLTLQLQLATQRLERGERLPAPLDNLGNTLETAGRQVMRLTRLVEDLLDVSRIQAGKLSLRCARLNLGTVVREIASRHTDQLVKVGCSLTLDIDEGIEGWFDQLRIEQVIDNLLSNVIKYAAGKPLSVSLACADQLALLTIEDNGPGIAEDNHAKIFERFERVTASRTVSGLGLGLYIVKQIVDAHGGTIRVESRLQAGTRFVIALPLSERPGGVA